MLKKLVILLSLLFIIVLTGCGGEKKQDSTQTSTPSTQQQPKQEQTQKNKPTMSKTEFEKIQNGMSYEEVTKIIGGPGELTSEVGSKGDQFYTAAYQYEGEGQLGANAILMFQGGKLASKSQFGLK